jgi:nucleoside-diphosphate-sugar epimerase/predicted dehydrogenase
MFTQECASAVREQPASHVREILVLGGGAVVRECFIPALIQLGLTGRTTIVEANPSLPSGAAYPSVIHQDFHSFLAAAGAHRYSHCIVALPNSLHRDAVEKALEQGMSVLCEKPLALTSADCLALGSLALAKQRVLAVNMVRRRFGSIEIARHALRQGWIGQLQSVSISHGGTYCWPASSLAPFQPANGGVLADMGIHYVDLASLFAGELEPMEYRDDYAGGVESDCRFLLRGDAGVSVDIILSRIRWLPNEIRLEGTQGTLRIGVDDLDHCTIESPAPGAGACPLILRQPDSRAHLFADYFAKQMDAFLSAGFGDASDLVGANDAARSAAQIEWAYAHRKSYKAARPVGRPVQGRALVTGATGFIGSHLIGRLHEAGTAPIRASYHSLSPCAFISRFPVEYHHTDLTDGASIRSAVQGCRYVFHVAYDRGSDARAINVFGTQKVVEAAIAEGVEAIVILSTMYVLGHKSGMVDETSPYRPIGGDYGNTKAEMERWCLRRAAASSRTRIVLLLPTCVYGPRGSTYTETPARLAKQGSFCWIEDGTGIANVTYVENLVDAILQAAVTESAHGRRYIINDESLTWREFLTPFLEPWLQKIPVLDESDLRSMQALQSAPGLADVVRAALHNAEIVGMLKRTALANRLRPAIKKYVPSLPSKLQTAADPSPVEPGPTAPPPVWLADVFGTAQAHFSAERARSELGWSPSISRAGAIRDTLHWLADNGLQ